jgi:hypothetical protein
LPIRQEPITLDELQPEQQLSIRERGAAAKPSTLDRWRTDWQMVAFRSAKAAFIRGAFLRGAFFRGAKDDNHFANDP